MPIYILVGIVFDRSYDPPQSAVAARREWHLRPTTPAAAALLTSLWFGAFVFWSLHGSVLGRGVSALGAAVRSCSLATVRQQHAQAEDGSPARPQFRVCLIPSSSPYVLGPLVV
ncbi:hypothetical protein NDU88_000642 [Pleurodeles waltl]|uniref:Uncharacterized protein n=1 Tax=Pleurodeles waltl TaxID=8319 RepID=A0AAV7URN2_PLEWA|nr:hypothetical protein NDU88_000642 [Pleurodeles waltl]